MWRVKTIKKKINIRYYAHLAKLTNVREETIYFDVDLTIDRLIMIIMNKYKNFSKNDMFLVSLNNNFVPVAAYSTTFLDDGDTVALFPQATSG